MHDTLLRTLLQHRPTLRARWEALLRAEPVASALGNPDTLVFLMDWTLNALFDELRRPRQRRRRPAAERFCPCGRNPLLSYFKTLEPALIETLFLTAEAAALSMEARTAGIDELRLAIREVARREIDTFCAVCQHQLQPPPCPRPEMAARAMVRS